MQNTILEKYIIRNALFTIIDKQNNKKTQFHNFTYNIEVEIFIHFLKWNIIHKTKLY